MIPTPPPLWTAPGTTLLIAAGLATVQRIACREYGVAGQRTLLMTSRPGDAGAVDAASWAGETGLDESVLSEVVARGPYDRIVAAVPGHVDTHRFAAAAHALARLGYGVTAVTAQEPSWRLMGDVDLAVSASPDGDAVRFQIVKQRIPRATDDPGFTVPV